MVTRTKASYQTTIAGSLPKEQGRRNTVRLIAGRGTKRRTFLPHAADEILCGRGEIMSREQNVALVEAYLDCFATKDLSKVSFADDVTFEGPRMPKLRGRATILGFLAQILPMVKAIQLKQHIVEGDYVATLFDMETVNGVDHVFDRIHIVDGQIKAIHAFYYPEQPPGE
jgi:hypothetical protein